jgi:hypothetical protein
MITFLLNINDNLFIECWYYKYFDFFFYNFLRICGGFEPPQYKPPQFELDTSGYSKIP